MICIGSERFFELPIIPAPKRNSKLHNEMWTNPLFAGGLLAHDPCAAPLHGALTSDTPVSCDGQLIPAVGIEPTRAFPRRGF